MLIAAGLFGNDLLPVTGALLGLVPLGAAVPFSLPILQPPAEHGLVHVTRHLRRNKRMRQEAIEAWEPSRVQDGMIMMGYKTACRGVLRAPTINLDVAGLSRKGMARRQWGLLLDGLNHPLQVVIPGRPASSLPILQHLRSSNRPEAWELAKYVS